MDDEIPTSTSETKTPAPAAPSTQPPAAAPHHEHHAPHSHEHHGAPAHSHEHSGAGHAHAPNAQGAAPREPRPPMQLREPNTILVGKKSVMAYVLAVVSQFNNGSPFVKIKARGMIISRAVDVAEIVRHRFIATAHAESIKIGTEELQSEDGTISKVSSIEIHLVK